MRVSQNLVYTEHDRPLHYDLVQPDAASTLIVAIHGGGWAHGDRTMFADYAPALAEAGFATALIEVRLVPEVRHPGPILDVQAFVELARSDGWSKVVTFGHSSGGHLALMAALYGNPPPVDAVVATAPVCDLTDLTGFLPEVVQLGRDYLDDETMAPDASPTHWLRQDSPPALIVHGQLDDVVPISQSERILERSQRFGGELELLRLEGEGHGFSPSAWHRIHQELVAFLQKRVG